MEYNFHISALERALFKCFKSVTETCLLKVLKNKLFLLTNWPIAEWLSLSRKIFKGDTFVGIVSQNIRGGSGVNGRNHPKKLNHYAKQALAGHKEVSLLAMFFDAAYKQAVLLLGIQVITGGVYIQNLHTKFTVHTLR